MSASSLEYLPIVGASHEEPLRPIARVPAGIPRAVRIVKRGIDMVMAIVGLLVTAALFPFLILAIHIDSRGPVFYRQKRAAGMGERSSRGHCKFVNFDMLKFRTMRIDAEKLTGAGLAGDNDAR